MGNGDGEDASEKWESEKPDYKAQSGKVAYQTPLILLVHLR